MQSSPVSVPPGHLPARATVLLELFNIEPLVLEMMTAGVGKIWGRQNEPRSKSARVRCLLEASWAIGALA